MKDESLKINLSFSDQEINEQERLISLRNTFIQKWSSEYTSQKSAEKVEYDGVIYYPVGHNASHNFYAGVGSDGEIYKMSIGDESCEVSPGNFVFQSDVKTVRKVTDIRYEYWGHY